MAEKKTLSRWHPVSLFVTFGVGNIPVAPGTWGSLPAFPIAFLAFSNLGMFAYPVLVGLILVLYGLGVWATNYYMEHTGKHDPKEVVVDEVIGQLLTLLIAAPLIGASDHSGIKGLLMFLACFALFRLFDISKPWPVSWADQKLESAHGVMLDDVLAGIYAGVIFHIGWQVISYVTPL